jgi:hypothetical protein
MVVHIDPGTTIQTVVNANAAGTTYCLRPGAHRLQSIVPKNNDIFIGEYGAILSGARALTQWIQDGSRWYVTGQTQQGAIHSGADINPAYPMAQYPEDLWFDNDLKVRVASVASVTAGRWCLDWATDRIYVGDNPAGKVVETSVTTHAFGGSATGITIKNLTIEKYANPFQHGAIYGELGSAWTVQYCDVRRNHGVGIRVNSNGLYERNRIYGNYQLGIGGSGTNIEVRYNEIAYNGIQVNYFWEGGGSKFAFTNGVNGHHNYVHHNYGSGLWSDINNDNTLYEYNTVEDNANNGIFHEISYDFIIRYNTVRRNGTDQQFPGWVEGAGIVVSNSGAGVVHDNTVADNWQQIMLFESARGTGDQGVWTTQNVTVRDNVIASR